MQKKPDIAMSEYFLSSNEIIQETDTIFPKQYGADTQPRKAALKMIGSKVEMFPNIWVIRKGTLNPYKPTAKCDRCGEQMDTRYLIKMHDGMVICQGCK